MKKYGYARVTSGELFNYLKDIDLYGRTDGKDFFVFGCKTVDEERFYKGILELDIQTQVHGFKNIEDVRQYWEEDGGDMFLTLKEGEYELNRKCRKRG